MNAWWVSLIMALCTVFVWGVLIGNTAYLAKVRSEKDTLEGIVSVGQANVLLAFNIICILITTAMASFFLTKIFTDESVRNKLTSHFHRAKQFTEHAAGELKKAREYAESLSQVSGGKPGEYVGQVAGEPVNYRCEALGDGLFERAQRAFKKPTHDPVAPRRVDHVVERPRVDFKGAVDHVKGHVGDRPIPSIVHH